MLRAGEIKRVLAEAVRQNRNVKGEDSLGDFHGVVVDFSESSSKIRLLTSGEIRHVVLSEISEIALNGAGGILVQESIPSLQKKK